MTLQLTSESPSMKGRQMSNNRTPEVTAEPLTLHGDFRLGDSKSPELHLYDRLVALDLPTPLEVREIAHVLNRVGQWSPDLRAEAQQARQAWVQASVQAALDGKVMPDPSEAMQKVALAEAASVLRDDLNKVTQGMLARARDTATAHRAAMLDTLRAEYQHVTGALTKAVEALPPKVDSPAAAISANCPQEWMAATNLAQRWATIRTARSELARRTRSHDERFAIWRNPERVTTALRGAPGTEYAARRAVYLIGCDAEPWCPNDREMLERQKEKIGLSRDAQRALAGVTVIR